MTLGTDPDDLFAVELRGGPFDGRRIRPRVGTVRAEIPVLTTEGLRRAVYHYKYDDFGITGAAYGGTERWP